LIEPIALPGGAKLLLERVGGTSSASIGFWYPYGSRDEAPAERGASHFCEHMMFKGTPSRSARDIAREIDRVGGYLNAFTERECVCFHCTVPSSAVPVALRVLCDMVLRSSFDEAEFDKEKGVIVSEIVSADDDPEEAAFDAYLGSAWPGHPISRKITGEAAEVALLERDGVRDFYARRFMPDGLVVAVAGSVDPEAVRGLLEDGLSLAARLPLSAERPPRPAPAPSSGDAPAFRPASAWKKADVRQVILHCGLSVPCGRGLSEYDALTAFNCAFGDSMSSRLFQRIREDKGYCYSVFSFFSLARDASLWTVTGSSTRLSFPRFLDAVLGEIRALASDPLSDAEIDEAILHLSGSALIASEDMEHRMKRMARQYLADGKAYSTDECAAALALTPKEIVRSVGDRIRAAGEPNLLAYGSGFKDGERRWKRIP